MALFKSDGYNSSTKIDLGDDQLNDEMGDQLKIDNKELMKAINQENLTDQIFKRILVNRETRFKLLKEAVPGAK